MTAKKKEPEEQQNANKPEAFVRDTALSIHQRIHAVMSEIEYVQKDGEFSMRTKSGSTVGFKHVTHDNVTGILRPGLIKYGILLVPSVTHREQVGQTTMLDITVDAVNIDRPDDKITFTVTGYGADNGDKGPGKAMSYACKYAMLKLFALVTGIDDEAQYHADKGPITAHQLKQLLKLIAEANRTEEYTCDFFNKNFAEETGTTIQSLSDMPQSKFSAVVSRINATIVRERASDAATKGNGADRP